VLAEVRPSFFFAVPRIYERIYHRVVTGYRELPPLLQTAVKRGVEATRASLGLPRTAAGNGAAAGGAEEAGVEPSQPAPGEAPRGPLRSLTQRLADRAWERVADKTVFQPVREALGGRVRFCVSGGAPMNLEVARFFRMAGIEVLEGYGLTETVGAATINPPGENRLGTVGRPLPGVRIRIAADGEILIRGDVVFDGYHEQPEETAMALLEDGWLATGDVGAIDEAGHLVITDRKKDLVITSSGKNISPAQVEAALRSSPYLADVMVFGDRRPYLVALVSLQAEELQRFARSVELPTDDFAALLREPSVQKLVDAEVERCNQRLAPFERVRRYRVLPRGLSIEGGELTPTLKVRRREVEERYRPLIEAMYAELPPA
jgi:long-chain acyl-CoA synthetase